MDEIHEQLFHFMLQSQKEQAVQLISQYADQNGYQEAVIQLLEPALQRFGKIWASQTNVSLAQGYIAARIAEEILSKAAESHQPVREEIKGPIVIGNIEDDYHALGRKLVSTFLRAYGWQVVDLGNDVLPEMFLEKTQEVDARIIAVSAMMYTTAINIKKIRSLIDAEGLTTKIKLAVGGAVFIMRPELLKVVGGDGTSRNALAAPQLMDSLWNQSVKN